jgi:hypothetical protein
MDSNIAAEKPISLKFATKDAKEVFVRYLCDRVREGVDARRNGGFDDDVRQSRDQYDGELPEKDEPWPDCSNLNVPFSQPIADTLHAHIYKTLTGIEPYFKGETPRPSEEDQNDLLDNMFQWIMKNDVGFASVVDEALLRLLTDKCAVLSPTWEVEVKKQRTMEQITPEVRAELAEKGIDGQIADYPDGANVVITRSIKTKNGVRWRVIDVLDFVAYPADVPNLKAARIMGHRYWPVASDLRAGVAAGRYDKSAVTELLSKPSAAMMRQAEEVGGDEARFDAEGILMDTELTAAEKPYECFQVLAKYDEDGDGEDELCLCEFAINERVLLSAKRYPYWHDRPFYILLCLYPKPGHLYPYSLMEKLANHQDYLNAMVNQRMDRGTLEISAPIVARNGLKREIGKSRVAPGMVFFDDNPRDAMVPMVLGNGSNRDLTDVQWATAQGYQIAGVNETVLASQSSGSTTATETERVLQSTNTKFDVDIDRMRRDLSEAALQTVQLYAQYAEDDYLASLAGNDAAGNPLFRSITRAQMMNHTGFTPQGTSALSNPAIRAQIAVCAGRYAPQVGGRAAVREVGRRAEFPGRYRHCRGRRPDAGRPRGRPAPRPGTQNFRYRIARRGAHSGRRDPDRRSHRRSLSRRCQTCRNGTGDHHAAADRHKGQRRDRQLSRLRRVARFD